MAKLRIKGRTGRGRSDRGRAASAGFTLIEVMMVVVIVGVLAMIAYPSYSEFIKKGNRAAAQAYLMKAAQLQQQFFNDARRFATTEENLNLTRPDKVNANYNVAFTVPDPNDVVRREFTITATPIAGTRQADDGNSWYTTGGRRQPRD
jgi:type IV pilus assembly protein PilE